MNEKKGEKKREKSARKKKRERETEGVGPVIMGLWAGLLDRVARMLAYFPPKPPTYELTRTEKGKLHLAGAFVGDYEDKDLPWNVVQLETEPRRGGGGGQKIVALHVPCPTKAKITILHSHGNAVDLGIMCSFYCDLSESLKVNVLGYDYSGYGLSTGKPSIRNTFADIRACSKYLVQDLHVDPNDIVLYGQSVGSGPTCELASELDELGGVVLHSPLASGMRVLKPTTKKWPTWLDIYPNYNFVPNINAPTLIMHGTRDEIIDIGNAKFLHSLCKHPVSPLWAEGYNHQNLDLSPEYLPKLDKYLRTLERK